MKSILYTITLFLISTTVHASETGRSKDGFDMKTFELGLVMIKVNDLKIEPVEHINYYGILAMTDDPEKSRHYIKNDLNLGYVRPVNAYNRDMILHYQYMEQNAGWQFLGEIGIGVMRAILGTGLPFR